jgi:hypothetical protein
MRNNAKPRSVPMIELLKELTAFETLRNDQTNGGMARHPWAIRSGNP